MTADCIASVERAIGELNRAARQKTEFPDSFMAGTLAGFAVRHLREAARQAPSPHRMRLARLAAGMRLRMRHTGRAPAAASLTVTAMIAGEIRDAIRQKAAPCIRTELVYPPIASRAWDWSAVDDNTYDGAPDSHSPIGYGPTEEAAIADLLEQLEEQQP